VAYCADWQDASKYPSPQEPSGLRWAWEFLRRNEQYALLVTWINSLPVAIRLRDEPNPDDLLEHVLCEPAPSEGLRTVADYRRHCRKHGIPAIVVTPLRVLRYCWNVNIPLLPNLELSPEQQEHFFTHSSPSVLVHGFLANSHQPPEFPFQKVKAIISSNEALLKIDFNQDIKTQFHEAKIALENRQKKYLRESRKFISMPDDTNPESEDANEAFEVVPGMKNYVDSLQMELRLLDAVAKNGGVLSKSLMNKIIVAFESEYDSRAITFARLRDWCAIARRRVRGKGHIDLVRFDAAIKANRKELRDKRMENTQAANKSEISNIHKSNIPPPIDGATLESAWNISRPSK